MLFSGIRHGPLSDVHIAVSVTPLANSSRLAARFLEKLAMGTFGFQNFSAEIFSKRDIVHLEMFQRLRFGVI